MRLSPGPIHVGFGPGVEVSIGKYLVFLKHLHGIRTTDVCRFSTNYYLGYPKYYINFR